jgi:hypothetical protein
MTGELTLVDDGRVTTVAASLAEGGVRVAAGELARAVRHPVAPAPDPVDLGEWAASLDRPLAVDLEERVAFLGVSAGVRAAALRSLVAPDFRLPDLDGRLHALSDQRGRKVLLVAFASW